MKKRSSLDPELEWEYHKGVNCGCFLGVAASVLAASIVSALAWWIYG